ncbi:MAG: carboxylating nicotinate-nucleotide diphosphorylase [Magnetococcales bacterium]|nr:carboxylating nicotinate-nucleotide diphosphorylase [Magnetococcales bacterium]
MTFPWLEIVKSALAEDVGRGDVTTNALLGAGQGIKAKLVAREDLVVCGLSVMADVFHQVDPRVRMLPEIQEGRGAMAGNTICTIQGPARGVLTGERVALNFFQHLSGVATLTRQYVERVAGTNARIVDTRKTVPGLRLMQKYAVRVGGGHNHRMGLDDGVLIKENHITLAGGVKAAVEQIRATVHHLLRIQVECETLAQVQECLEVGVHAILLDNMDLSTTAEAVRTVNGRALVEASGNMNLDKVRAVAETGVDLISVGAITRSAASKDVSLLIDDEA